MKTYLLDIIPRIQRWSQRLDDLTVLTNQNWVVIDEIENTKLVFIFKSGGNLLIAKDGEISDGQWEYLSNTNLIIQYSGKRLLMKIGFYDENILALKIDNGREEYALLANETKFPSKELNTLQNILEFLNTEYILNVNNHEKLKFILPNFDNRINFKGYYPKSKLPEPDSWTQGMMGTGESTLILTTMNWRQFCVSHSPLYPIYTFIQMSRLSIQISSELQLALGEYAKSNGYESFQNMLDYYFSN